MIHGHDSLYYHGIEEGSHKWQGLRSRDSDEQQEKIAEEDTIFRILAEKYFISTILSLFFRFRLQWVL